MQPGHFNFRFNKTIDSSNQKDITPTKGFALQNYQEQQQNVQKTTPSSNNSFLGFKKTSIFTRTAISSQSPSKENTNDNSNGTEASKLKPAIFKTKFAGFSIIKKGMKVSPSKVLANKHVEERKSIARPLNTAIPKIPLKPIESKPVIQSEVNIKEIQPKTFISTPIETSSLISSRSNDILSDPFDYDFEEEDLSIKDKEFDKYAFVKYWNEYFDKVNEDMKILRVNLCMLNSQLICSFDPTIHLTLEEIEKRSNELEFLLKQT